jgi:hypothetical protein
MTLKIHSPSKKIIKNPIKNAGNQKILKNKEK